MQENIQSALVILFRPSGETSKTISIPIGDDAHAEGAETFSITLSNPTGGAAIGANKTATITITDNGNDGAGQPNPIDNTTFFVRQHYLDFLGREPDSASAGWITQINQCVPLQPTCDRLSVSQGIYNSPEFKDRGYFIYKFFSVALGRKPDYHEFVLDHARVSGFQTDVDLEQSKVDFIAAFMARAEFANAYNGLSNDQFVQTLFNVAGVTQVTVAGVVRDVGAAIDKWRENERAGLKGYSGESRGERTLPGRVNNCDALLRVFEERPGCGLSGLDRDLQPDGRLAERDERVRQLSGVQGEVRAALRSKAVASAPVAGV